MKKFTVWFFASSAAQKGALNSAIGFLRIFSGLAMLPYGIGKVERYSSLKENFFGDPIGIGNETSLIICIFQQIFCSLLMVLGLQSRFAAFMLFTNMAVAVKFHFFDPFCAVKALPTVFLAMYAFLIISGGGAFALDNVIYKRLSCKNSAKCALKTVLVGIAFCLLVAAWAGLFAATGSFVAVSLGFALLAYVLYF